MAVKTRRINPLRHDVPIVDESGYPTRQFQVQWQSLFLNADEILTVDQAVQTLFGRKINTGTGLSGGGDLSQDRTISLDADIDDLNDVDTSSVPPTDGQVLTWDDANSVWAPSTPASGGGGGGGLFAPPTATTFNTVVTGGTAAATVTDDATYGLVIEGTAGTIDNFYGRMVADGPPVSGTSTYVFRLKNLFCPSSTPTVAFCLRNTSNSRRLQIGVRGAQDNFIAATNWSSNTAFSANLAQLTSTRISDIIFRVDVTSTGNVTIYYSLEGTYWKQWTTTTLGAFLTTYDQVGFGITMGSSQFPTLIIPYYNKS